MRFDPAIGWVLALAAAGFLAAASAAEFNPVRHRPAAMPSGTGIQRIIVKLRAERHAGGEDKHGERGERNEHDEHVARGDRGKPAPSYVMPAGERVAAIASRVGVSIKHRLEISPEIQALHIEPLVSGETLDAILTRLRADPDVEYAELDRRRYPHALPNDPGFNGQWYLQAAQASSIDATTAWDNTTGSTGVVIAELDTGVRFDHPDLQRAAGGRLLSGYDFVSADPGGKFVTANDGDGRDPDASDPGDWITQSDVAASPFSNCEVSNSSWHGTRVAGILGALTDNALGVAGISWRSWILPVRVLGKCGGFDSDVIAGMRWAAGLTVPGVPGNPYPAKIENLSLGGEGACTQAYQDVIDELAARGVLVVVSAGNEGGPVDSPANCRGAAGIAGLRHAGTKAGFSNLGPEIAVSAPAGNCVNTDGGPCLYSLDTTSNAGTTVPGANIYTDQINFNLGTSFSAPIVAGIAGLMVAVNGNLNSSQLVARLQEGAVKPFPTSSENGPVPFCHVPTGPTDLQTNECACTTSTCGAGMVNANGAVSAALRPIAAIAVPASVNPGQNVTLQGGGSAAACGRTINAYAWSIAGNGSNLPGISNSDTATATVIAPASGSFTVQLTVTDDAGRTDSAAVVVSSNSATTSAPASAGSSACPSAITPASSAASSTSYPTAAQAVSHGGGGAIDAIWPLVCVLVLAMRMAGAGRLRKAMPAARSLFEQTLRRL